MQKTPHKKKPKEEENPRGMERLGDILRVLIEKQTGRKIAVQNVKIFEVWDKAVGQQIARVAKPQSFTDGRLIVGTTHPTWVTELSFRREDIREKLNRAVGYDAVREIIFRLSRRP